MSREIERWVRRLPDQYLWMHRRFKTRPPGAPSIY
jgi:lauroyl/myristoyl acyltransferase